MSRENSKREKGVVVDRNTRKNIKNIKVIIDNHLQFLHHQIRNQDHAQGQDQSKEDKRETNTK